MKVFKEEQHFSQTWLILIIILCTVTPFLIGVYGIYQQIINKTPFGDKPMSDVGLILFTISMFLLSIFIFFFKLKTRIDEIGIHYQFFPFHLKDKTTYWSDINKIYTRTYNPIGEFGGWGIKNGSYTISGNIGIQLDLKDGKKVLIGTKKENEVKQVLVNYNTKIKTS